MPEEETKEEGLTIEEEEVDITIGTTMMRIERQEIGDRVHRHHQGTMIEIVGMIEVGIEEVVIEMAVEGLIVMSPLENEEVTTEMTVEMVIEGTDLVETIEIEAMEEIDADMEEIDQTIDSTETTEETEEVLTDMNGVMIEEDRQNLQKKDQD
jgi:hypothetical protein